MPTDLIHRIGIAATTETIYRAITTGKASGSGAKVTAVQTLPRLLDDLEPREASGLRRVHRRFWRGR